MPYGAENRSQHREAIAALGHALGLDELAAATAGSALYALLVPAATVAIPAFVSGKALYGTLLGGTITAMALHRTFGEETRA